MNKLVLAFSGGMDSSVLLYMAAVQGFEEIHTLSFDYGQRHKRELANVADQISNAQKKYPNTLITNRCINARYIREISAVSSLTNNNIANPNISEMAGDAQPITYVPFRNMQFLSICAAYAESLKAGYVWYGAAQVDSLAGMWDGTHDFVDAMNRVIEQNRRNKILIEAPLLHLCKKTIIQAGVDLGVDFSKTWTCYSDREDQLADVTTPSSSLRLRGFLDAGYKDPIKYLQHEQVTDLYDKFNCKDID